MRILVLAAILASALLAEDVRVIRLSTEEHNEAVRLWTAYQNAIKAQEAASEAWSNFAGRYGDTHLREEKTVVQQIKDFVGMHYDRPQYKEGWRSGFDFDNTLWYAVAEREHGNSFWYIPSSSGNCIGNGCADSSIGTTSSEDTNATHKKKRGEHKREK